MANKRQKDQKHADAISRIRSMRLQDQKGRSEDSSAAEGGEAALEEYHYFDAAAIREGLMLTEKQYRAAKKVIDAGELERTDITVGSGFVHAGYERWGMEPPGTEADARQVKFVHYSKKGFWMVEQIFGRRSLLYSRCSCWKCSYDRRYQANSVGHVLTGHETAAYLIADNYMRQNAVGDITNSAAMRFLSELKGTSAQGAGSPAVPGGEILTVRPKFCDDGAGHRTAQFQVGAARMYKVRDIPGLVSDVRNHRSRQYGKNTTFRFGPELMDAQGKKWIGFMENALQTLRDFAGGADPVSGGYYYFSDENVREKVTDEIPLIGSILDEFYDAAASESGPIEMTRKIAYDPYGGGRGTEKLKLRITEGAVVKPRLTLDPVLVSGSRASEPASFDGVRLHGEIPDLLKGALFYYNLRTAGGDAELAKIDSAEAQRLRPLMNVSSAESEIDLYIGRSALADFYRKALPELKEFTDITEKRPELIRKYIPVEPEFVCYLDVDENAVLCEPCVYYGEKSHTPFDSDDWRSHRAEPEHYRDTEAEAAMMDFLLGCMAQKDRTEKVFLLPKDDDTLFAFLDHGLTALMERCEVRATDRFLRLKIRRRIPMNAGISLADGMLSVELTSDELSPDELLAAVSGYRKAQRFVRLKNGDFLKIEENEELKKLAEMMETMQISPKELLAGKMHIPAFRALYLDKMMESMEDVYANRDSHFKKLIKEFKTISDADYDVPFSLRKILRKYQTVGYRWMRMLDAYGFGGILADDMGLGKTLQAIALLLADHDEYVPGEAPATSLVVCPASLIYNWEEELHRFASPLQVRVVAGSASERRRMIAQYESCDVLVTSYDLLKRDIAEYEDCRFHYEIIDEAQYIKNMRTEAAKSVKLIKAKTRFALTGTPIENRLSELWSIFDFIMPGFLFDYGTFLGEFEAPIVRDQDEERLDMLRRMTAPFILRRSKEEVLKDLPEKLEEVHYAGFGARSEQRKLYDAQVVRMREDLRGKTEEELKHSRIEILAELTRIRQICCDPALLYENYKGDSVKKDMCMELVRSVVSGEHKALIFSQFTRMLDLLKVELDKEKIPYYEITGATPKEVRIERVKAFNGDRTPVFLISLKAGGTGLNLTGADVVIHYDPWWNIAVQNQATDRAHRIGQTKVVTVYKLILKGTIEERILEMQQMKRELAEDILSAENVAATAFSREELLNLLESGISKKDSLPEGPAGGTEAKLPG